jgi:hypothetical protein
LGHRDFDPKQKTITFTDSLLSSRKRPPIWHTPLTTKWMWTEITLISSIVNCIDTMYCLLHAKIIQSSWPYYFLCGTIISKWFGYIIHLHKTDWINLFLLIYQFGSVHSYDIFYTQAEWNKSSYLKFYLYASLKLSKVKLTEISLSNQFCVNVWYNQITLK